MGNMRNLRGSRTLATAMVGLALCGCGGGEDAAPTAPAGTDLDISIVSGNGQHGLVGTSLSGFLVVRVRIAGVEPAEGVPVEWSILEGGGELSRKGPRTDREGLAAAVLFLGDRPGEQVIRAALESGAEVLFTAQALSPAPPSTALAPPRG